MNHNYIERLRGICYHELNRIYDPASCVNAFERLREELEYVNTENTALNFLLMKSLADHALDNDIYTIANGPIAGSFIAYLLKITKVDPLKPHYLCSDCKHTELITSNTDVADMTPKKCPCCGNTMYPKGHDIPAEMFCHYNDNNIDSCLLGFEMSVPCINKDYPNEEKNRDGFIKAVRKAFPELLIEATPVKLLCSHIDDPERKIICPIVVAESKLLADLHRIEEATKDKLISISNGSEEDILPVEKLYNKFGTPKSNAAEIFDLIADEIFNMIKINNFETLWKTFALHYCLGVKDDETMALVKKNGSLKNVPITDDEVFLQLISYGVDDRDAISIVLNKDYKTALSKISNTDELVDAILSKAYRLSSKAYCIEKAELCLKFIYYSVKHEDIFKDLFVKKKGSV